MSCPFGGGSGTGAAAGTRLPLQETNRGDATPPAKLPTGRQRVQLLYEQYVHLPLLRDVWERPTTERPVLEPCFAAGFHGIELALLLLSEFVADGRTYVSKQRRVEQVADDIAAQCQLLVEVIDAELEEELQDGVAASRLSLTQPFPFEGCPPTKAGPCHSPGLHRLTEAVHAKIGGMSSAERNSVIRLVINISAAFSAFERWSVGLGVEHQLSELRQAVGLPNFKARHSLNLDYDALVQPWRCEQTVTGEVYTNPEDFFFRTVHLGTDCWAFIALSRTASAQAFAEGGNWHLAAARSTQASRILAYLGDHLMLLTSMNLRDYLLLKVELEGTSGEGSVQVKDFKPTVAKLFQPLAAALLALPAAAAATGGHEPDGSTVEAGREAALLAALLEVYEWPDRHAGLYSFCKALETLETGVLGGFYFKHYCLATNVIGSEARGTMKRAVAALKAGYEVPIFPLLDRCKVALGAKIDAELADRKGRMMHALLDRYRSGGSASPPSSGAMHSPPAAQGAAAGSTGCPFGFGSSLAAIPTAVAAAPAAAEAAEAGADGFEAARQQLYSWEAVPAEFQDMVADEAAQQAQQLRLVPLTAAESTAGAQNGGAGKGTQLLPGLPLAFLDHAWGQVPPPAQYRATRELAALHQLGNSAWDAMFGRVMPQAATHIKSLLGLPPDSPACCVQFGHNSHSLVTRLLSALVDCNSGSRTRASAGVGAGAAAQPLRVLASSCEFYSVTRQLNRLMEAGLAEVEAVPAEPADNFAERCCAALEAAVADGWPIDVVYVSTTTYLTQQTLVPSIPAFVRGLRAAVASAGSGNSGGSGDATCAHASRAPDGRVPDALSTAPLIILDGYHGFAALPTDLAEVAGDCCYVAGMLKHAGCGANCAFMTLPTQLAATVRPVLTGWLADPSVLSPSSTGISFGSEVGFSPDLALQGGTPAFLLPLLTFNHLMQLWREAEPQPITVEGLHRHVMGLHAAFLSGLDAAGHPTINSSTLLPPQDTAHRSHTLVFRLPSAAAAATAVHALAARALQVDCRQGCLRIGFGPNHSMRAVASLLAALRATAQAAA